MVGRMALLLCPFPVVANFDVRQMYGQNKKYPGVPPLAVYRHALRTEHRAPRCSERVLHRVVVDRHIAVAQIVRQRALSTTAPLSSNRLPTSHSHFIMPDPGDDPVRGSPR